jgi:uncharacterized protein YciI
MKQFPIFLITILLVLTDLFTGNTQNDYKPPWEMTSYTFGFLVRGDKANDFSKDELKEIQAGHLKNITKMADLGKLVAAGPFGDDTDLRGIFIFSNISFEEATILCASDPAIENGRLKLKLFKWYGPKGIGDKYFEKIKIDSTFQAKMVKYQFGILKKGSNWSDEITEESTQLQFDHLNHITKMAESGKLIAAGPFSAYADDEFRGILIFNADAKMAEEMAKADPAIQTGKLILECHPWFVAEDVMP